MKLLVEKPRGRATQKVRPGITIKKVLSGKIPLVSGEIVSEAACTDIHQVYRALVKKENIGKKKPHRQKGMTYQSFATLFRFAKYLGLIEFARDEPSKNPPAGGPLYNPMKVDGIHAVVTMRRLYRLTQVGRDSDEPWSDLCQAWIKAKRTESPV